MENADDNMFKKLYSSTVNDAEKISVLHFVDYFLSAIQDEKDIELIEFLQNIGVFIADVTSKEFHSKELVTECVLLLTRMVNSHGISWMVFDPDAARCRLQGIQSNHILREESKYYLVMSAINRARVELISSLTTPSYDSALAGACFQLLETFYPIIYSDTVTDDEMSDGTTPTMKLPTVLMARASDAMRDVISAVFSFISSYPMIKSDEGASRDPMYLAGVLRFSCFWICMQGETVVDALEAWIIYVVSLWDDIDIINDTPYVFPALDFATECNPDVIIAQGLVSKVMTMMQYDAVTSASDNTAYREALLWILLYLSTCSSKNAPPPPNMDELVQTCARLFVFYAADDIMMALAACAVTVVACSLMTCNPTAVPRKSKVVVEECASRIPAFLSQHLTEFKDDLVDAVVAALSCASSVVPTEGCTCIKCLFFRKLTSIDIKRYDVKDIDIDIMTAIKMYNNKYH